MKSLVIEAAIVDAYNEDEQLSAFAQAFEDNARFPFRGLVVGVEVAVMSVDFEGDERPGIVAICQRAGNPYSVSLLDITPTGAMPMEARQLIDAYRRWSNASPLTSSETEKAIPWVYPRFASADRGIEPPLGLTSHGECDPATEYWGEPGEPIRPLCRTVISAGPRPSFEMEQVIPRVDEDDWDSDPIIDAADLHHAGHHREAIRILENTPAIDKRCIDAWGLRGRDVSQHVASRSTTIRSMASTVFVPVDGTWTSLGGHHVVMLIVHATRKLAQRLGGFASAPTFPSAAPALGAWYATAIFWKPQVVLFVSESTLLPVFVPLAPATTVLRRFPAELEAVLRRHGVPGAFIGSELSTLGDTACLPTANRSIVGVLNEYVRLAGYAHDDLGSTPDLGWLADWLAQTPMGPLHKRHGSANRELAALIASA